MKNLEDFSDKQLDNSNSNEITEVYADICDPEDEVGVEAFKQTLQKLNAEHIKDTWGVDVKLDEFKIRNDILMVFCDDWSLDIKGPKALVDEVVGIYRLIREK